MERARAEKRFNDVRQLSDSLIFDVHDAIQNLPGATPARKLLLDRAVQYLDRWSIGSTAAAPKESAKLVLFPPESYRLCCTSLLLDLDTW